MFGKRVNASPEVFINEYSGLVFLIESIVNKVNTMEIVKVVEVDSANNKLTVIPVVKKASVENEAVPESNIYGVKYFGWQFGENAIKAVPEVGDIGVLVVSKRDISSINSGIVATNRKFCLADGIYIGGLCGFNKTPTQFIEFNSNGISVTTPTTLSVSAKDVDIQATGNVTVTATTKANVIAKEVILGSANGAAAVARVGDVVDLSSGKITSGSTIVKAG